LAHDLFAEAKIGHHSHDLLPGTNPVRHRESTVGGGTRILVDVSSRPRLGLLTDVNHQFPKLALDEHMA
jgi:hypothetical protein